MRVRMTKKGSTTLLTGVMGTGHLGQVSPEPRLWKTVPPSVLWFGMGAGGARKITEWTEDTGSGVHQLWILVQVPVLASCEILSKLSTLSLLSSETWENHWNLATGRAE